MNTETKIILLAEDFGVDMERIYLTAMWFPNQLPKFIDIYDSYKIDVIGKNLDLTVPVISEQLEALRSGIDFDEMKPVDIKELDLRNEIELFNYLLNKHYSFSHGKEVFNSPVKDVW